MCEGEFESEWTEAEAIAEKERDFGSVPLEECDQVCDVCYKQISPQNNPEYYEHYLATVDRPVSVTTPIPKGFPLDDAEAIRAYVDAALSRKLAAALDQWEAEELLGISRN